MCFMSPTQTPNAHLSGQDHHKPPPFSSANKTQGMLGSSRCHLKLDFSVLLRCRFCLLIVVRHHTWHVHSAADLPLQSQDK